MVQFHLWISILPLAAQHNHDTIGTGDDGSGTITILEVLRLILSSKDLLESKGDNAIHFHWYSGEEPGALGSRAIFRTYARTGKDAGAMLQQEMTGFYNATIEKKKEFGLMMDVGGSRSPE